MSRTTLQIPLDTSLRDKAEKAAKTAGFSSVQEVVRVFLNKFAFQSIDIGFYDKGIQLSKKAEQRYARMIKDVKKDKDIIKAKSFNDLISILD